MKHFLGAFALLLVSSTAFGGPILVGFYQGGFDEGAYLAGLFSGIDKNGDGILTGTNSRAWDNDSVGDEIFSYNVFFSENSLVSAFTQTGTWALEDVPCCLQDEQIHRLGLRFNLETNSFEQLASAMWDVFEPNPSSACLDRNGPWDPENPYYCEDNWEYISPAIWFGDDCCGAGQGQATSIFSTEGGRYRFPGTKSTERISVFRVPEPASIALFTLGLAGLGWSRRKKA